MIASLPCWLAVDDDVVAAAAAVGAWPSSGRSANESFIRITQCFHYNRARRSRQVFENKI